MTDCCCKGFRDIFAPTIYINLCTLTYIRVFSFLLWLHIWKTNLGKLKKIYIYIFFSGQHHTPSLLLVDCPQTFFFVVSLNVKKLLRTNSINVFGSRLFNLTLKYSPSYLRHKISNQSRYIDFFKKFLLSIQYIMQKFVVLFLNVEIIS